MSGLLCCLPSRGREFRQSGDRPLAEAGQHVVEILSEMDVQAPAGFHARGDGRHFRPRRFAADVQPVFATQGQGPYRPFTPVVVDLDATVVQKFLQPAPLPQGVVARFGQGPSWGNLLPDSYQPVLERRHHGRALFLPQRLALRRAQSRLPGFFLHRVKFSKARDHFARQSIQRRHFGRVHKTPPRMRHAPGKYDAPTQIVVSPVAVALQRADKSFEERRRSVASAAHSKIENHYPARRAVFPHRRDASKANTPPTSPLHTAASSRPNPGRSRLPVPLTPRSSSMTTTVL